MCLGPGGCNGGQVCLADRSGFGACECGPVGGGGGTDAGFDAGIDAGIDAGLDAGVDAGTDAGIDAGPDDAGTDAGLFCTPKRGTTVALQPVVAGLTAPVMIAGPAGDDRLFVIEQAGVVKVIENGQALAAPFLDLTASVLAGGERGLLGIAFHPAFASNHRLYLNFTRQPDGATVVAEFLAIAGTDSADPLSRRDVIVVAQPFSNHNGGMIEFGTDGFLYIALGDGGSGGDPQDRAQDDRSHLGKILRIDVDTRTGSRAYGIPPANPFASSPDGPTDPRPELWHKGLRNPFRFSFDAATGDIYIGDVGQENWEEIDVSPNTPGINWGWDDREGAHCYEPMTGCLTAGRTDPIVEFNQSQGWASIIGGQVYRGTCFPDLAGRYFFGDYAKGELWSLVYGAGVATNVGLAVPAVGSITAIHSDGRGELYVVTHAGTVGRIVVP